MADARRDGSADGHRRRVGAGVVIAAFLLAAVPACGLPAGDGVEAGSDGGPVAASDGQTWSRVAGDGVFDGRGNSVMHSVVRGGPGLVAVGTAGFWPEEIDAAVWTSSDGVAWTRVPHDDAVFGGSGQRQVHSVVAGGPGLVAVGADTGHRSAAVWTSPDGRSWSRVAHDEDIFGGSAIPGAVMRSVAAGGPGLVAVGADNRGETSVAAVWTSPDGQTWSRVTHNDEFGTNGRRQMNSVVASGPGLVAVGEDSTAGTAAVWTSTDGHSWTRIAHDEDAFGGPGAPVMISVVAGGPGLVAVGEFHATGTAAVWTSPDGLTWSRVIHADDVAFAGQRMNFVTVGGPGLVAVGSAVTNETAVAAVWLSTNGDTWSRVADNDAVFAGPDYQTIWSVTAGGPGLVAVGGPAPEGSEAVWISD